ncbi:GtrA family protein [Pseudarthrobacter sulfonivorans]|uniref:GtrA family protein n=1 Tax=Pseudarthrobacter sulfonivorans TaxID=121292 RepID=UPI0021041B9B|nr:GtrA family protein [Pseudarthrobacter sulfonivorans]
MINSLADRIRGLASLFWREVAKFGAVGGVAFVIDNGMTYYLMHGPMTDSEAKARFVGASIATVFSWIANRLWTFRHRRQANVLREFLMFILINGIGIGISTGFTALAKYSFNVTDKNLLFSAGVVGILVATVVRFFAYRFLVFNQELDQEPEFSHDHEIVEAHHRDKAVAATVHGGRATPAGAPGSEVPDQDASGSARQPN